MDDAYDYELSKGERFLMGYKHNRHTQPAPAPYLFRTLRLIRITEGGADWRVGGYTYTLGKDDLLLLNTLESRQIVRIHPGVPFQYDLFAFPFLAPGTTECLRPFFEPDDGQKRKIPGNPYFNGDTRDLYQRLIKEAALSSAGSPNIVQGLLLALLGYIGREWERTKKPADEKEACSLQLFEAIEGAAEYIRNHSDQVAGPVQLAAHANYSRGYFSEMFKKYAGISINEYINRCRLDKVCSMLEASDVNILDAALACGYKSSAGFYKAFNRHLGMSPTDYLRSLALKKGSGGMNVE